MFSLCKRDCKGQLGRYDWLSQDLTLALTEPVDQGREQMTQLVARVTVQGTGFHEAANAENIEEDTKKTSRPRV